MSRRRGKHSPSRRAARWDKQPQPPTQPPEPPPRPDEHCPRCGTELTDSEAHERTCGACGAVLGDT